MKYNVIIVDDEFHAIDTLCQYIERVPNLALIGTYENPLKALEILGSLQSPQIAFLDIDMPELSGLTLAENIRSDTHVIFTTAHEQYALNAFGLDASGYLLKPFSFEDFLKTVQKVCIRINKSDQLVSKPLFFNGNSKGRYIKIMSDDIIYLEALLNYTQIYTTTKSSAHVIYLGLKEVGPELFGTNLIRVHRSFVINTSHLELIEGNRLTMSNGKVITLGGNYREAFFAYLHRYAIKTKQKNKK